LICSYSLIIWSTCAGRSRQRPPVQRRGVSSSSYKNESSAAMLYLTFAIEILIMLSLPVGLALVLRRQPGVTWGIILAGAITFVGSQAVHLPLNWALGLLGPERGVALWPLPLMSLVVGLSAGVCEEGARYLVLRLWRRDARSWTQGVAFGAGHGGVESIFAAGLVLLTFTNMLVLRRMDLGSLGLSGEMLEQAQAQVEAYWSMAWYLPLLGGLERVFGMVIHVALSLLVVQAVVRDDLAWLLAAVGAHAVVDGVAVVLARIGWPPIPLEGVLLAFALAGLGLVLVLRPREPISDSGTLSVADVSRENLT
jgi:uncharacterized membrane protein YhfC